MISTFPEFFWALMLGFAVFRMSIPTWGKLKKMNLEPLLPSEQEAYDKNKNQNIALASFTIVVIALAVALHDNQIYDVNTFVFLSLAMFMFFIASLLFEIGYSLLVPYIAETLQYAGILSLATGFIFMIENAGINSDLLSILYIGFLCSIIGIVILEQFLNYKHHK